MIQEREREREREGGNPSFEGPAHSAMRKMEFAKECARVSETHFLLFFFGLMTENVHISYSIHVPVLIFLFIFITH